jgi:hypothetical protein
MIVVIDDVFHGRALLHEVGEAGGCGTSYPGCLGFHQPWLFLLSPVELQGHIARKPKTV